MLSKALAAWWGAALFLLGGCATPSFEDLYVGMEQSRMAGYSARATLHDGPLTGYETKVTIGGTPEGALLLFYERRLILFALYIRDDSGPKSGKAAVAAAAAHFQNKGLLPLASLKDEDNIALLDPAGMEALLDAIAARKADAKIGFASREVVEKYGGYPTLREAMDHADPEDFYCSIESAVRQRYFSVGCMLLKTPQ